MRIAKPRKLVGLCDLIKLYFENVTREELEPLVKNASHVELGHLIAEELGLKKIGIESWELIL